MDQQVLNEYRRSRTVQSFRYVAAVVLGLTVTAVAGTGIGVGVDIMGQSDVNSTFAGTSYDTRPFHRLADSFSGTAGVVLGGALGVAAGIAVWPNSRRCKRNLLGRFEK